MPGAQRRQRGRCGVGVEEGRTRERRGDGALDCRPFPLLGAPRHLPPLRPCGPPTLRTAPAAQGIRPPESVSASLLPRPIELLDLLQSSSPAPTN